MITGTKNSCCSLFSYIKNVILEFLLLCEFTVKQNLKKRYNFELSSIRGRKIKAEKSIAPIQLVLMLDS
jgi:hypothetical protein